MQPKESATSLDKRFDATLQKSPAEERLQD